MNTGRTLIATIAGFAAIGFAILSIMYAVAIANPPPELSPTSWDWTLRGLVIGMIVGFSVYLLAAPDTIGEAVNRRSTRFTANAVIASVVAIVVAVLLNVIADRFATARADLTANQTFTLSDQTIKVLEGLTTDVTAHGFFRANDPGTGTGATSSRQQIEDLFKAYQSHSTHFKFELLNYDVDLGKVYTYLSTPDSSPELPPAVVFDSGKKRQTTHEMTEAGFTTALVKLNQDTTPTVTFLTGHGERSIADTQQNGYSQVQQQLVKEGYNVTSVNLLTGTLSLSETTVLVIAAPQQPLSTKEVQDVQKYLDGGGRAMVLFDTSMAVDAFDSMKPIVQKYGVTPIQGAVLDLQKNFPQLGPLAVIVDQYPSDSEITRPLQQNNYLTLFPASSGLRPPTSTVEGFQTTSIVQSSVGEQLSYLDTTIKPGVAQDYQSKYKPNVDIPGPVSMGVTIAPQDTTTGTVKTRLVVFGDSDFATNNFVSPDAQFNISNRDLVANSISWLSGASDLISIRAKNPAAAQSITLDAAQQRVVFFSSVFGLPILILMMGAFVWWRRK